MLTFDEIREIIKMVDQSSIQHFELDQEETKIVIGKYAMTQQIGTILEADPKDSQSPVVSTMAIEESVDVFEESKENNLQKIISPTVGTFYCAPEPGADPFVKIGQRVESNTIVCVLEAMKLFNEVEAGITGEILEILVKDGDFIEYGQALFIVKTE